MNEMSEHVHGGSKLHASAKDDSGLGAGPEDEWLETTLLEKLPVSQVLIGPIKKFT